jgi:hypothetical protein
VGTNTGTATVTGTDLSAFNGIKEVIAISSTRADGQQRPLSFAQSDVPLERDRYAQELSDEYSTEYRYPSDAQRLNQGVSASIIQRRGSLYVYPTDVTSTEPLAVTLEAYGWLRDYTTEDLSDVTASDFFIEHGFQYMQWGIVCELNYIFQRFVPRQEGVLGSPENLRESAWRDLILWDTYMVGSNTTRSR